MKTKKIKQKNGTVVEITTNESGEYICDGYDAENDITKSHEEIICKIAEIDLKIVDPLQDENLE